MSNLNKQIFLKRFNSISEQGISRTNSPTTNNLSNFNTGAQTKKIIEKLQKQAKDEKQKRQDIQTKYESFKERFVIRERQFYRILQKFNTTKQNDTKDDVYISQIYQKILCTFDAFNEKARQLLDDRYSELYRLMERRIDILMQKMDKQLSKYRKISQAERKQIQQSIREMGAIAAQTENQNIIFRKKNSQLQLRLQMLNEEKRLLLEEIVRLKGQNSKLEHKQRTKVKKNQNKKHEADIWDNVESIRMQIPQNNQSKNGRNLTSRNHRYGNQNVKGNTISTMRTVDFIKSQRGISSNQQSIINHLKQCLHRQKNKNLQLIKFSLQLQGKQKKIKELIVQQINKKKTQSSEMTLSQSFKIIQKTNQSKDFRIKIQSSNEQNENALQITPSDKQSNEKKQISILINELNKILNLPQTQKNNANILANNLKDMKTLQLNYLQNHSENYQQSRYSIDKKNDKNQIANNSNHRRKLSSRKQTQSNKSGISNHSIIFNDNQSRKSSKNPLFINYLPLNIAEITRQIEIK